LDHSRRKTVEIALELIEELTSDESMMWVVGGGPVVSENNSKGIQQPERHDNSITVEAENWHFHISLDDVAAVQFVETKTHGERLSYYVRFSGHKEETLLRSYFPNPYLDENYRPTPLQPDRLQVFTDMREKYVGRDGIVFVHYVPPSRD
jgi:putative heme iron utilization protein